MSPDLGSPPSPCIDQCKLDSSTGLCTGCLRTIDEIVDWRYATDEDKRAILENIQHRRSPPE